MTNHAELERAVLGAILVNNEAFHRVRGILLPQHFAEPLHREIFAAAAAVIEAGKAATPVTLKSDAIPGRYLAKCAAEAATVDRARSLAIRIIAGARP